MKDKKVVIIGAGPAGITAGVELLKNGDFETMILEGSEAIGGISQTIKHNGNRIDIGGHRFFTKEESVNQWWNEIMKVQGEDAIDDKLLGRVKPLEKGGPNPEKEDKVMLVRDRVSRIYYLRKFFDYPIKIKPRTFINMGFVRTVKAGTSYVYSAIFKRKEKNLEDFMVNRFGKALYGMFFEKYTEKVWGEHPTNISADWGAQRIKGLSLMKALFSTIKKLFGGQVETSLIEQFHYPKFGPGQLWETAAEKYVEKGGVVKKSHRVNKVNVENGRIVSVECDNGEIIDGDIFISTMPIKDLIESISGEAVPENVVDIATKLPYRDFMTVGILVDKLKIKNQTKLKTVSDIVPDCWIYIQEEDVKMGRLQIFNNWSPYMVEDFENKVWIGLEYFCNEGDEMWSKSDDEFKRFAANELVKIGIIDENDVIDSLVVRVKKAYPAYFGTYKRFDEVVSYLNGFENLYCIGRNGQHRYNNMDHSMLTAFEAVDNIVNDKKDKSNIWNVNVEGEYHEAKSSN